MDLPILSSDAVDLNVHDMWITPEGDIMIKLEEGATKIEPNGDVSWMQYTMEEET